MFVTKSCSMHDARTLMMAFRSKKPHIVEEMTNRDRYANGETFNLSPIRTQRRYHKLCFRKSYKAITMSEAVKYKTVSVATLADTKIGDLSLPKFDMLVVEEIKANQNNLNSDLVDKLAKLKEENEKLAEQNEDLKSANDDMTTELEELKSDKSDLEKEKKFLTIMSNARKILFEHQKEKVVALKAKASRKKKVNKEWEKKKLNYLHDTFARGIPH